MGCCMSNERNTVFEVTIDEQGKAHRVAEGEGTHIIRITPDQGEILERKAPIKPSEFQNAYYAASKKPSTTEINTIMRPFVSCFPTVGHKIHPTSNEKAQSECQNNNNDKKVINKLFAY